jgi:hypothetical protein
MAINVLEMTKYVRTNIGVITIVLVVINAAIYGRRRWPAMIAGPNRPLAGKSKPKKNITALTGPPEAC